MAGKQGRIPAATKQRFFHLVGQGMSPVDAARQLGFSRQSSWRLMRGLDSGGGVARSIAEFDRREEAQPQPKPWTELSPDAQEALRDLGTFAELFLCRRRVPWRSDAAMRTVEALADRSERSFVVMNAPPEWSRLSCLLSPETRFEMGPGRRSSGSLRS